MALDLVKQSVSGVGSSAKKKWQALVNEEDTQDQGLLASVRARAPFPFPGGGGGGGGGRAW